MKDYKVELKSIGNLTQVPDSPKLFGALMYMYSDTYGEEKTTALTRSILGKSVHVALSNIMPSGYLPTPQEYWINAIPKEGVDSKSIRAAIKKRVYMKPEAITACWTNLEAASKSTPYVCVRNRQQLRASIDSVRYDLPELEARTYSVPTVQLWEIDAKENDEENSKPVSAFYFYIQVDDSEPCQNLMELIRASVETQRTVILGKRASQGLNMFKFQEITPVKTERSPDSRYLNLGMLLPACIEYPASVLRLFTSERRPFQGPGIWVNRERKWFISFIAEGSVVVAPQGPQCAGKSIESPFFKERDIVFGNAYLYPILLNEEV